MWQSSRYKKDLLKLLKIATFFPTCAKKGSAWATHKIKKNERIFFYFVWCFFAKKGSFPAKIAVPEKKEKKIKERSKKKIEQEKYGSFLQKFLRQGRIKKWELTSIPKIQVFRIQQPPHQKASIVSKDCPLHRGNDLV